MEKFDHLYISITQEVGGLEGLFTSLFSFLLRRTDFFYEADPGDKMGFPPGVNEKMLLTIFNKFRDVYYKTTPKKSVDEYAEKYVKYAKENNLPLPKGVKPAEKIEKSLPNSKPSPSKIPPPNVSTQVKEEPKIEKVQEKETTKVVETKKGEPKVKKNDLFSDIR
jgi:hypothetical protein